MQNFSYTVKQILRTTYKFGHSILVIYNALAQVFIATSKTEQPIFSNTNFTNELAQEFPDNLRLKKLSNIRQQPQPPAIAMPTPNEISKFRSPDRSAANHTPTQEPDNHFPHRSTPPPPLRRPHQHITTYTIPSLSLRWNQNTLLSFFNNNLHSSKYSIAQVL